MILKKVKKTLSNLPTFKRVVIGVSGGVDSVVLAHCLKELGYQIVVVHLNHGLREKESDADEAFVIELAQEWKVPFVTSRVQLPQKGNVENEGRKARYAFFEKVRQAKRAKYIAVAHHQDDQIETILLHLERGAGLKGLCGMDTLSLTLLRPLLSIPKAEILKYAKKNQLKYRTDQSNFDLNFRRNRLRHLVIPELRRQNKDFNSKVLQLACQACQRHRELQSQSNNWVRRHVGEGQFNRLAFVTLPKELQSEILLNLTGRGDVYRKNVDELRAFISNGSTGKKRSISTATFHIQYDEIHFSKSAPTTPELKKQKLSPGITKWGKYSINYKGKKAVYVRQWQSGDRFQPAGMKGSKKIQDFFTDSKIPRFERKAIPIIVDQRNCVLSISDIRVAQQGVYLKKCLRLTKSK